TSEPYELVDANGMVHEGKRSRVRIKWQPERIGRVLVANNPEPVYQPEDLDLFRGRDGFLILDREGRDRWIEERKAKAEKERLVLEQQRAERDAEYVAARQAEVERIRGSP